ncbi:DUF2500 domain-containing protein [Bacillus oleivorans]|nr:DUF2500 domain-containing protein [Bacillus oleivorans]
MEQGLDLFNLMNTFVPLFFIIIIGIIIFSAIKGISQWSHNNRQPVLHVKAFVVTKRTRVSGGANETPSSTSYYVTFEVDSGDRMEFQVNGSEYGYLAEGDQGTLEFQGTRYLSFTRMVNQE